MPKSGCGSLPPVWRAVSRRWLYLAECALALGSPAEARRLGLMAHRAAPAWPDIVMRLAAFTQALGEKGETQRWLAQHNELERRMSHLLTSLA